MSGFFRSVARVASRVICVASLVVAAAVFVGCGESPPGQGDRLSIASGGTGGVYFVYGGGLANLISENIEGYEATSETTSASVDNMLLVGDGSSDIAFAGSDSAVDGVMGEGVFEEPVPARVLAQLYVSPTQTVALEGSGIESIEDLEGRRVSIGAPNSSTELISTRILEAAGIDPDTDIERAELSVAESADALGDGTIDAFFWGGGLPTGAVTDLASTEDIALLPSAEYVEDINAEYSDAYTEAPIPAGTYEGVDEEVDTLAIRNFLVVNEEMEEELAYEITNLLFERREELVEVHPEAEKLSLESARNIEPLEFHPGAQRYYEEQE